MNEEIIQSQENVNTVSLRIAQAMLNIKKISDRIIGYVQYDYSFLNQKFNAISNRPAKITPLERAVVGILKTDGSQDLITIGNILGFDVIHDSAEREILNHAIESMRTYGVLEGDDSYMSLTEKGKIFASTGERPETYKGSFELWIDPNHAQFTGLKNCLKAENIEDSDEIVEPFESSLDSIKLFAEQQASNFQTEKLRYVLSDATYDSHKAKRYRLYVCFLQSVRDDMISTFVYDDYQNILLHSLSEVIDNDQNLKQQLLEKCIAIECENEDAEVLANSTEKEKMQTDAEQQLIADEENAVESDESKSSTGTVTKEGHLRKKALYDSLSFEAELHNIFVNDGADEIWMISPWIGHAFVNQRLSYIKSFLNSGNKIFIAYSKEEASIKASSSHGEMVAPAAQKAINNLEKEYPTQFFCVQLPAFHTKNVIEKKGEQCIMFTGSFNVLSFSVNKKQTQIRREEMALAHHQMAINKYDEYLKEFIDCYIDKVRSDIALFESTDKDEEIANYKLNTIDVLIQKRGNKEDYLDFFNEFESKQILAKNALWLNDVEDLQSYLSTYFKLGSMPNKDKFATDKKFANLTRRFVNLTVSADEKEKLDDLYSRFKNLPSGKTGISKGKINPSKKDLEKSVVEISDIYERMSTILKDKQKGRFITSDDITLAKKLSGPQNRLETEEDLLKLLVALNLLCSAVRMKVEKKMQISDVYNSLIRLIKKADEFHELSLFTTSYKDTDFLFFDINGIQFRFEAVPLSLEHSLFIRNRKNVTVKWNGSLSYLHACELLEIVKKI